MVQNILLRTINYRLELFYWNPSMIKMHYIMHDDQVVRHNYHCYTAGPSDVLINTAQLVAMVKDLLTHRLLTNIHRGGCDLNNIHLIINNRILANNATFSFMQPLGLKRPALSLVCLRNSRFILLYLPCVILSFHSLLSCVISMSTVCYLCQQLVNKCTILLSIMFSGCRYSRKTFRMEIMMLKV